MKTRFCHPGFPRIIAEVVRECLTCQVHKGNVPRKYPVYRRTVTQPFEIFAVDLMDLPRTKRGNKSLLVGIDLYSKYAYAVPLKSKQSYVVCKALESRILAAVPRTPICILSDNGPEFRAQSFDNLMKRPNVLQT